MKTLAEKLQAISSDENEHLPPNAAFQKSLMKHHGNEATYHNRAAKSSRQDPKTEAYHAKMYDMHTKAWRAARKKFNKLTD